MPKPFPFRAGIAQLMIRELFLSEHVLNAAFAFKTTLRFLDKGNQAPQILKEALFKSGLELSYTSV